MKTRPGYDVAHPHLDHLLKIGMLNSRTGRKYPARVRRESLRELMRYRDEGLIRQGSPKEEPVKKTRADEPQKFSGRGILFAVIDDREGLAPGRKQSTVDIITEAMEQAMDEGNETSEDIARYLVTNAFHHVPDRRVRFNSVLKAGDVVGAQIISKLRNAYTDIAVTAEEEEDSREKERLTYEAKGFAEAIQIVLSPFSCESLDDPRLVNWEEVDRLTDLFEKEQRFVRKERNGNPQ